MSGQRAARQSAVPGSVSERNNVVAKYPQAADRESVGHYVQGGPALNEYGLPLDMAPAPVVQRLSDPIDLGEFHPAYVGWKVVYDLSVDLSAYEMYDGMSNAKGSMSNIEAIRVMREWIAQAIAWWNFTDKLGQLLPQPRDGGAVYCREELLKAIAQGFVAATRVPKA